MSEPPTGIPPELGLRLDAIRRRISGARDTLAAGGIVDLAALTGEVQDVCEALRTAPLQMDHEAVARDIEAILHDLNRLEQDLRAQNETGGGNGRSGGGAG